jgi:hypothetical protein
MEIPVSETDSTSAGIPAEFVETVARVTGVPLVDDAMARRIAAGASAAVEAVQRAAASVAASTHDADTLFDREPSEYLQLLESLAESLPVDDSRLETPAGAP